MKRSRACDDLRALECSATNSDAEEDDYTGQRHHHHAPPQFRRVKRTRRVVDMVVDTDFSDIEELSEGLFAAFRLDAAAAVAGVSSSSSSSSLSTSCSSTSSSSASVGDCDFADRFATSYECLPPIRRNSRECALPVVECDTVGLAALQFKKKLQLVDTVDTPETDMLDRFPFDKHQAFASLFMLPVNPNR